MKSWIKTLLITLLAAALCLLFARVVLPLLLSFLVPPSLEGAPWYWINLLLAGFFAGLLVAPLLRTRRYYPVPLLLLLSTLVVVGSWAQSRCNDAQLQAIEQLERRSASHSNLGFSEEQPEPSAPVDLGATPDVWAHEQGYGYGYSCTRPGETLGYLAPLLMGFVINVLGLLLALLIGPGRRRAN
ncbi:MULTISPECIES: hypothetical protein [Pseudomonas]|uniref:Uncharacterized protein n=1 Tax=Pseudomonas protegens TaxID=380021 RepID=A0A2T6GTK3_9PSED|nr:MULTISPECIES: hypothetical protein [Pseudomonas]PUA47480.1 hypothetical protein C5U62_05755 [Pseudomonas protegens]RXU65795.1 hypothetical protein CW358_16430 [Pseudomonas protegens]ULT73583.1 hypothetical protein L1O02_14770 [Pseudomonas sp. BC42]BAQ74905.1 uncharacterized protein POS17_3211 [Pseudomonas sp. Os17]BAQ81197.1 uncharacterized protein PST29_3308 [Pseudomonas sp. St29]